MKDQYFGDIIDYKKYSLLKLLTGNGKLKTAICWALTENDGKPDGGRIKYLKQPEVWKRYDPIIFEHLKKHVLGNRIRTIRMVQRSNILSNCVFFDKILRDDVKSRSSYFERFLRLASSVDFVFFDPDNGLEVKSVRKGRLGSSRYIYLDEIERAYGLRHSVLLYQHFPRVRQEAFIKSVVKRFKAVRGLRHVISYRIANVVFLLLPLVAHEKIFLARKAEISRRWGNLIKIDVHEVSRP